MKLAVCVVVRREDGKALFIERAQGKFAAGYWTPVTGRVEPGEDPRETARREVREEVGLEVEIGRELGRTGTDAPPGVASPGYELIWFDALVRGVAKERLEASEVARARWLSMDEACSLTPLFPTTLAFLRKLCGA